MKSENYEGVIQDESMMNSAAFSEPEVPRQSKFYEYSTHDRANLIKEELKCSLFSILVIIIFTSLITFTMVFGLKYVITTTRYYGDTEHCLSSHIHFNGWNFMYECLKCDDGYVLAQKGLTCEGHHSETQQETHQETHEET